MAFDVDGARKAGYSDAEIVDHLAGAAKFDAAGARAAGYNDSELLQHLQAPKVGPTEDAARGFVGGVGKGLVGIAAAPAELSELGARGISAGVQAAGKMAKWLGYPIDVGPERTPVEEPTLGFQHIKGAIETGAKKLHEAAPETFSGEGFYKPEGRAGRIGETVGELAPGIIGSGSSIPRVAQRAIKFVAGPGVAAGAVGEITDNPYAKPITAAVTPLLLHGVPGLRANRVENVARGALPEGVTPQHVDQAGALMQSAQGQGVTLSWPEALSQVTGRPVGTDLLRQLEASPGTATRMGEFFGPRAQQLETAGREAMNNIAPANTNPSTIGPAVGRSAEEIVRDAERARTAAVSPLYKAADTQRIPHPAMQKFINELDSAAAADKTGIVGSKLKEIRNLLIEEPAVPATPGTPAQRIAKQTPNGAIYQTIPGTPGTAAVAERPLTDIGNIDRVRKYVRDQLEMPQIGLDAITKEQGAAILSSLDDLEKLMTKSSPKFAAGKQLYEDISTQTVEPLRQGPVGKLADRDITTQKAASTLFPPNPLPNSADEITQTVTGLVKKNPKAATDVVRAHTEQLFNQASRDLQGGPNQMGAAKFRAALVGNPQQQANFEAAILALPHGGQRLAGFNRFLDVAEATGTRQNVGSKTAYNTQFLQEIGQSGLTGEAAKAALNPLRAAQFLADRYQQWVQGRNLGALANLVTDPGSLNKLRAIAAMPTKSKRAAQMAARLLMQIEAGSVANRNESVTR